MIKGNELTKCYGKVKHNSYSDAIKSIRGRTITTGMKNSRIQPYKCNYCGFYHVGHKAG